MRFNALLLTVPAILALAACSDSGRLKNPFAKEAPFVPTAIPADFAIQVDENHDTFQSRQHIGQTISTSDSMSTTTYTTFRDLNNGVSNRFSQETPLKSEQLQAMWNAVARYHLMDRSTIWINWYSGADLYKHDSDTLQIRANGRTAIYHQSNGFAGPVRPLMLQVEAVRLPLSQDAKTPVVTPPEAAPIETTPAPATQPATMPSLPGSPLLPETAPSLPTAPLTPGTPSTVIPAVPVVPPANPHSVITAPPAPTPPMSPATQAITPMESPKFTPDNIKNGTPPK